MAQAFRRAHALPAERIHVTGCPRFDYCFEPWRRTLTFPREQFVLVNTNFSAINPQFKRSPAEEREAFLLVGWNADYVDLLLEDFHRAFAGYLAAVEHLAQRLPQQPILIRPHPFENAEVYEDRFSRFPNVVVDGRGSVLHAISHARCVVHLNCGTAVELVMLERVPLALEFLNTARLKEHTPLPGEVSHPIGSLSDLVQAVQGIDAISATFPFAEHRRCCIDPWFHLGDGQAASRVADRLSGLRSAPSARSLRTSLRSGFARPSVGQLLQGLAATLVGPRRAAELRVRQDPARHAKGFTASQAQSILDRLEEVAGDGLKSTAIVARHPVTKLAMSSVIVCPARNRLSRASKAPSLQAPVPVDDRLSGYCPRQDPCGQQDSDRGSGAA